MLSPSTSRRETTTYLMWHPVSGRSESGISFIKFGTEGDTGATGGFCLYGNRGNQILSGADM